MNTIGIKMNTIGRIVLFMISYIIIVGIFQYVGIIIADVDITDSENTKSSIQQLTITITQPWNFFTSIPLHEVCR